jgi:hypothetical protein
VAILDREKQFSAVGAFEKHLTKNNTDPLFPKSQAAMQPGTSHSAVGLFLAQSKKVNRIPSAPIKLFQKLPASSRMSQLLSSSNTSTASKDGGVGLPTFAVLSAEIQVRSAAEHAMGQICNNLTNFPPKGSEMRETRLSSMWDEIKENIAVIKRQEKLRQTLANGIKAPDGLSGHTLRYFSLDNRLIIGVTERPHWRNTDGLETFNEPQVGITIRDGSGKNTWFGNFKYKDDVLPHMNPDKTFSSSVPDLLVHKYAGTRSCNIEKFFAETTFSDENDLGHDLHTSKFSKAYCYKSVNESDLPNLDDLISQTMDGNEMEENVEAQRLLDSERVVRCLDKYIVPNLESLWQLHPYIKGNLCCITRKDI